MIEATKAFNLERLSDHPSVIILSAKNENRLHRVRKYLIDNSIQHVHFYEPDMDDELTALATEPICGSKRDLLRKYQLLDTTPKGHRTRYARQYPDGSYYFWAGECGSSPHRCWRIEDATLFDEESGVFAWHNKDEVDFKAVPVKICYHVKNGGAA